MLAIASSALYTPVGAAAAPAATPRRRRMHAARTPVAHTSHLCATRAPFDFNPQSLMTLPAR